MPPKAASKEKVVKGDEAEELVLQYLKSVNRPYASTDVSANLKGKVPKASAQKVLTNLAEKGLLTVKAYGKQTIFVYNQSQINPLSAEELGVLDSDLKEASDELEVKRKELRILQNELSTRDAQPRTKDLNSEIARVTAESEATRKALNPFRGEHGDGPKITPLSPEEIKMIDDGFTKWRKEWVDRRKVYKAVMGVCEDSGMVENVATLQKELGLEVDDEEAQGIEKGEFCFRVVPIRASRPQAQPQKSSKPTQQKSAGVKRPAPVSACPSQSTDTPSQEEVQVKKKKTSKKA